MNHHDDSDDESQEYSQDEYHCDMICDLLKLINGSKTLTASRYGTRDYDLMTNSRLRMLIEITKMELQDETIKPQNKDDATVEYKHTQLIDQLIEILQTKTSILEANDKLTIVIEITKKQLMECDCEHTAEEEYFTESVSLKYEMIDEINKASVLEAIKKQKEDDDTVDTYEDEHEELIDELFEIFQNATCRLKANQYSGCYLDSLTNDELITLIRESRDEINKASIAYDIKKQ